MEKEKGEGKWDGNDKKGGNGEKGRWMEVEDLRREEKENRDWEWDWEIEKSFDVRWKEIRDG